MESMNTIETNNQRIYDAGYDSGKQAEYDAFWDGLLDYGTRINYNYFLNGKEMDWFKPKYDIKPRDASWFARDWGFNNGKKPLDLAEVLRECGVKMDFSNATNVAYLFYNAKISHLPEINVSNATAFNYLMFGNAVKTIDKFIAPTNKPMTQVFGYCSSLENIVFGSEIGGDLIMKDAKKLSKDSIKSVINCLSTTTSGLTVTLSQTAVDNAFTAEEWSALEATKSNWNISLV